MIYQYPPSIDYCLCQATKSYIQGIRQAIKENSTIKTCFGDIDGARISFANNHLDRFLISRFPEIFTFGGLPYIELGANDGFVQSNTILFELMFGMNGILMEPLPAKYEMLLSVRSNQNFIHYGAAVPFGYNSKWVEVSVNNLMSVTHLLPELGAAPNDLDSIEDHIINDQDSRYNYSCMVAAEPLQYVIDRFGYQDFSLLSLDVEGNELSVLQGIDFSRTRFRLIVIESRDISEVGSFLRAVGYICDCRFDELNYLFRYSNELALNRQVVF